MDASMVPACSEIVPDPPAVQTENLTSGALSDADFRTWVTEDEEWWTLVEWAQQHNQADFITYLLGGSGDTLTTFVRAGGTVVDSTVCEYPEKVDAISTSASQMVDLTDDVSTTTGVVFALAAVGPCTSTWTAAGGAVTEKTLGAGQEGMELDVTATETTAVFGQFLVKVAIWDVGNNATADALMQESGI